MAKIGLSWINDTIIGPFLNKANLNKIAGGIEDANTYYTASGVNDLVVSTPNGNYKYNANTILNLTIPAENTGAMTVNVDSEGATNLLDENGDAFTSSYFEPGQRVTFVRNSANTVFIYAPKGGGVLKGEVQSLSASLVSDIEVSVSISEVDLSRAIIIPKGSRAGGGEFYQIIPKFRFIDSTHVGVKIPSHDFNVIALFDVMQLDGIASLQTGSFSVVGTSLNITISPVDEAKTTVIISGYNYSSSIAALATHDITSSTNLNFTREYITGSVVGHYQIIESK